MRQHGKKRAIIFVVSLFCTIQLFMLFGQQTVYATETDTDTPIPISFDLSVSNSEDSGDVVSSIQILVILTIISLAPSILIMTTSFTRIIVVLHFIRSALGTQQSPPNQVLIGLALFLTLFIMQPIYSQINEEALQPYSNGEISQQEAIDIGLEPLREFMFDQVRDKDLRTFIDISRVEIEGEGDEFRNNIPTSVLIPAFVINELRVAFIIGFLIYIPFIVVDMVVASTLMSMGMMMLPPVMISMPFKLLLFVLADGWNLVIRELVATFFTGT